MPELPTSTCRMLSMAARFCKEDRGLGHPFPALPHLWETGMKSSCLREARGPAMPRKEALGSCCTGRQLLPAGSLWLTHAYLGAEESIQALHVLLWREAEDTAEGGVEEAVLSVLQRLCCKDREDLFRPCSLQRYPHSWGGKRHTPGWETWADPYTRWDSPAGRQFHPP